MEDKDFVMNEIELKALAFDFIATKHKGSGLSSQAEITLIEFVSEIVRHFKGV